MHPRAADLIARLGMIPHPEGGHFCEVFRSSTTVIPADARTARPAVTTIYFLLQSGEHSALHRVLSDEIWHYYEGDQLDLVWWEPATDVVQRHRLGPVADEQTRPVAVVPARWWAGGANDRSLHAGRMHCRSRFRLCRLHDDARGRSHGAGVARAPSGVAALPLVTRAAPARKRWQPTADVLSASAS